MKATQEWSNERAVGSPDATNSSPTLGHDATGCRPLSFCRPSFCRRTAFERPVASEKAVVDKKIVDRNRGTRLRGDERSRCKDENGEH